MEMGTNSLDRSRQSLHFTFDDKEILNRLGLCPKRVQNEGSEDLR